MFQEKSLRKRSQQSNDQDQVFGNDIPLQKKELRTKKVQDYLPHQRPTVNIIFTTKVQYKQDNMSEYSQNKSSSKGPSVYQESFDDLPVNEQQLRKKKQKKQRNQKYSQKIKSSLFIEQNSKSLIHPRKQYQNANFRNNNNFSKQNGDIKSVYENNNHGKYNRDYQNRNQQKSFNYNKKIYKNDRYNNHNDHNTTTRQTFQHHQQFQYQTNKHKQQQSYSFQMQQFKTNFKKQGNFLEQQRRKVNYPFQEKRSTKQFHKSQKKKSSNHQSNEFSQNQSQLNHARLHITNSIQNRNNDSSSWGSGQQQHQQAPPQNLLDALNFSIPIIQKNQYQNHNQSVFYDQAQTQSKQPELKLNKQQINLNQSQLIQNQQLKISHQQYKQNQYQQYKQNDQQKLSKDQLRCITEMIGQQPQLQYLIVQLRISSQNVHKYIIKYISCQFYIIQNIKLSNLVQNPFIKIIQFQKIIPRDILTHQKSIKHQKSLSKLNFLRILNPLSLLKINLNSELVQKISKMSQNKSIAQLLNITIDKANLICKVCQIKSKCYLSDGGISKSCKKEDCKNFVKFNIQSINLC